MWNLTLTRGRWIVSRTLHHPAHDIWRIITDTSLWAQWGPSVSSVECQNRFITAKSHGRIKTSVSLFLPFTISHYESGEFWSWRVGGFEATGHRVTPLGPNTCRLGFDLPWWAAPYIPVCLIALKRIAKLA